MDTTQGLTRRLSFGGVALPQVDGQNVEAALSQPSAERLRE